MFHREKMVSINLFQTKGLEGLVINSRFSKSTINLTEKAIAVLVPTQVTKADCLCHVRVSKHE